MKDKSKKSTYSTTFGVDPKCEGRLHGFIERISKYRKEVFSEGEDSSG